MSTYPLQPPAITVRWPMWKIVRFSQFGLDAFVMCLGFTVSYLLRFDFEIPNRELFALKVQLPIVVLIEFFALYLTGVPKFIWRYVGIAEVRSFSISALIATGALLGLRYLTPASIGIVQVPLSISLMNGAFCFGGLVLVRMIRRMTFEQFERKKKEARAKRGSWKSVLLIGAGRAGVIAADEIRRQGNTDIIVVGFVDDDPGKRDTVIHGIKVIGASADIPVLAAILSIDHVIITIAQASRKDIRRIVEICESVPLKVRIIPGIFELLSGKVEVTRIRDIQIQDLLGREPVHLDDGLIRDSLKDKVVMITGAGGSIGSELVRQVIRYQPSKVLLVERAEFALFAIEHEVNEQKPNTTIIPIIADVGDDSRMRIVFSVYRPEIVIHAAAHKHVPMLESNPTEAIKNNVVATHVIGELAGEYKVKSFVMISTDKAVNPTSVMGASKRVAELIVQDLNRRFAATKYVAVRFGNVIGSTGSVIPIFQQQILKGGPVTVTHKDMKRYFMTIPEATQLVLQASSMGRGGEIFILDMGEPVRILDLARETITLSGLKPDEDIRIDIIGIRPGEKLFEELQTESEMVAKTRHPKIFIGNIAAFPQVAVELAIEKVTVLAELGHDLEIRKFLNEFLPEASLDESIGEHSLQRSAAAAIGAS